MGSNDKTLPPRLEAKPEQYLGRTAQTRPGRPTLSDAALALLPPEAQVFKLEEQFPLTIQERQLLKDKLGVSALTPLITNWLKVGGGTNVLDRVTREAAAGELDAYVGGVFALFCAESVALVRARARNVIAVEILKYEKTERTVPARKGEA